MKNPKNKKEVILKAASAIVLEQGADAMTIETVAKKAGLSKGGLLYHFPTKEILIQSMLTQLVELVDNGIAEILAEEDKKFFQSPKEGRWLKAYVLINTVYNENEEDKLAAALFAAFSRDPKLLEPWHQAEKRWQTQIENDGIDPSLATIIRLATDGFWLNSLFQPNFYTKKQKQGIQKTLLELIESGLTKSKKKPKKAKD